MLRILSLLLGIILFSGHVTSQVVSSAVNDQLHPLTAVKINGFVGNKIDALCLNRILAQDFSHLVEPFKHRNETRLWQTEFWGKWVTSAIGAYQYNHDPKLLTNIKQSVADLLATQTPDGYIGNYADNAHLQQWDIWGRKYTLLGLLEYYSISNDKNVLKAAVRLADHLMTEVGPGKTNIVKTGNHRGMASSSVLQPIVLLYEVTGEKRFLDFANYIVAQWEIQDYPKLISKALAGVNVADRYPHPKEWFSWENGVKAYEMMSCYEGLLELYRVTGSPLYLSAVEETVQNIIKTEINLAGSGSAFEGWYHGHDNQIYPCFQTNETCVATTWVKLCFDLLKITGKSVYADQIEKSLYNSLLGAVKTDGSTLIYYTQLEGYKTPGAKQCGMDISCCIANGPRAFVLMPRFAVMKSDKGIAVNLYCQSEAKVKLDDGNNVLLKQTTNYPESDSIVVEVIPEKESNFPILFRIPEWSEKNSISVNGQYEEKIETGSYKPVSRTWKKGDRVTIKLDLRGKVVRMNHHFALTRGPILLARDSRLGSGDVDESAIVKDNNGIVQIEPCLEKPENMWMCFNVPLQMGSYVQLGADNRVIRFCDFASAGNEWSKENRYKVWLEETIDVRK
ncbi:MAG: glycoside hydrolase family 127 protein [Prolixibacteraceae bacterium]|nr:glycoside hydrolase family 127 protein [Prolixibacteraceae bacterium]